MTTTKWEAPAGAVIVATTTLNDLAVGGNAMGSEQSNDAGAELDFYADFQLYLAAGNSPRATGGNYSLYLLPEIGDNFAYGSATLDPQLELVVGSFSYDADSAPRYAHLRHIMLPPTNWKALVINNSCIPSAPTGNILVYDPYSVEST